MTDADDSARMGVQHPRRPDGALEAAKGALPTERTLAIVKSAVNVAIGAELSARAWPPGAAEHALLDLSPMIALGALVRACPGVGAKRLAACLGLEPVHAAQALPARRARPSWPGWIEDLAARAVIGRGANEPGGEGGDV